MLRSQAVKVTQACSRLNALPTCTSQLPGRYYTTTTSPPPPSGQPAPNPKAVNAKSDNTLLYTGVGLAAAAGAYYYLKNSDKPANLEKKARYDEERIRVNAHQALDATKDRADDTVQIGRAKVNHVEDAARDKYDSAKSRVQGAAQDAKAEGRGLLDKAEDKLEYGKKVSQDTFNQTKANTEALYRNVRDSAEQKTAETRAESDKVGQEVKEGWFSWLGYGKSKVDETEAAARDARRKLDGEAERLRKDAARGVANAAEDVRVKAEKRA